MNDDARAVVIERTAKRWKAMQLAGGVGVIVGVLSVAIGAPVFGILSFFFGTALYVAGRVAAWWHHG